MSEFEAAVERVWPGRGSRFEILGGGITNHNLKVEVDGETFVLRVAGKDTDLLGIDRSAELAATAAAAAAGIGPAVVRFVEPEGWLVTRFIEGEIPPIARMREPDMLVRVARALRAFHDGSPIPGSFDSVRVVEIYRETALARGGAIPEAYAWAHEIAQRIERRREDAEPQPCHNDLLNANFLDDGGRL
jgi:thiamine kinase-like enzyme